MTLGNQAPSVTLAGPASVRARENATFRATASDADGTISTYLWDFDGDGTYELDSDGMPEASTIFPTRGRRTVGVQVLDDSGAAAFATFAVNVTRALRAPDTRPPLSAFRLNRTSFGGAAKRALVITYRLREKARVEVKLRRGERLVRLIDRGVRKRNRYYRIRLKPSTCAAPATPCASSSGRRPASARSRSSRRGAARTATGRPGGRPVGSARTGCR